MTFTLSILIRFNGFRVISLNSLSFQSFQKYKIIHEYDYLYNSRFFIPEQIIQIRVNAWYWKKIGAWDAKYSGLLQFANTNWDSNIWGWRASFNWFPTLFIMSKEEENIKYILIQGSRLLVNKINIFIIILFCAPANS